MSNMAVSWSYVHLREPFWYSCGKDQFEVDCYSILGPREGKIGLGNLE